MAVLGWMDCSYFINALPDHLSPYQTGTDERVERIESLIAKIAGANKTSDS